MADLIHLHSHSYYSFRDGVSSPRDLAIAAKEKGQTALALTEHGNIHSAVIHAQACQEVGIKPIFGIEAYEALDRVEEPTPHKGRRYYHFTLLVQNEKGWENLVRLHNKSWTEGFHRVPRIDYHWLAEYGDGLIGLSGCVGGRVQQLILQGDIEEAIQAARRYQMLLDGNFYLENMNAGFPEQIIISQGLQEVKRRTGIPTVATNDIHYCQEEQGKEGGTHHIFKGCFGQKEWWGTDQLYLKDAPEMLAWGLRRDEIEQSVYVADLCNFDLLSTVRGHVPKHSEDEAKELHRRLDQSLSKLTDEYKERANRELELLIDKGFAGYFLILQDIVTWAKDQKIPVGPGRGSVCGSLIAYLLEITDVDPLKYDLLFERFLTQGRNSLPDIDLDVSQQQRGQIIKHLRNEYGTALQISAFQTLGIKALLGHLRHLITDPDHIKLLESKIPQQVGDGAKIDRELSWLLDNNEIFAKAFATLPKHTQEIMQQLDGAPQHGSLHAAGILLSDTQHDLPIIVRNEQSALAWDMYMAEDLGFLKVDLLGLRTIDIIHNSLRDVGISTGHIPEDDPKTLRLLREGNTTGIFQIENKGFTNLLRRMKLDSTKQIIDAMALYRPGPLDSGITEEYTKRSRKEEEVVYPFPELEDILESTFGLPIYQEQIMQMSMRLAGFDETQADDLRRSMGKKKIEEMEELKDQFVSGMIARKYSEEQAEETFTTISKFARYGFNKAHATAYGLVSYWTAFLKAHFPRFFYMHTLNSLFRDGDQLSVIISDMKKNDILLLPPDINESDGLFSTTIEGIRFGLLGIKGIGQSTCQMIIEERKSAPFQDFQDFCRRISSLPIDKKKSLIAAGAFDNIDGSRNWLLNAADVINKNTKRKKQAEPEIMHDYSPVELSQLEQEILGFPIYYDPFPALQKLADRTGSMCGCIIKVKKHKDKRSQKMAFLETTEGIPIVVFASVYSELSRIPKQGDFIQAHGRYDDEGESWLANDIQIIEPDFLFSSDDI